MTGESSVANELCCEAEETVFAMLAYLEKTGPEALVRRICKNDLQQQMKKEEKQDGNEYQ